MSTRVSFQVTTYFKRPEGEAGITRLGSKRLNLGEAVDWILGELPEEAVVITPETEDGDTVTIRIDWAKVPGEIRAGAQ